MSRKLCSMFLLSLLVLAFQGCKGAGESQAPHLVAIEVTPADASIAVDTDQQFNATGVYSDNSTKDLTAEAEWSSADPGVAIVGYASDPAYAANSGMSLGSATRVYGTGEGTTTIEASVEGVKGSGRLRVKRVKLLSVEVTPASPAIAVGSAQQFSATGTFSDNTTQDLTASAAWTSSNPAAATIAPGGMATSVEAGTTTITAKHTNITGSTDLTVSPAGLVSITVVPANKELAKGTTHQFTATGLFSDNTTQDLTGAVTWSSSDTWVATVENTAGSRGVATAVAPGKALISAASGDTSGSAVLNVSAATLVSIGITPSNPAIAKGTGQQFTATGTFSDNSVQDMTSGVTWSSSNTAVATISNAAGSNGLASSVGTGSTTIKAVSGTLSGSTTLSVNPATLVSIELTPSNPAIAKGTGRQFTATGLYSDNSTQDLTAAVTWSSSNTAVATISNAAGSHGLASSVGTGATTIKAVSGTLSGSTTLTVNPATLVSIELTPSNPAIAKGTGRQFTATGLYSDNSTQNLTAAVTWSSSNTAVATISNAAGSHGLASSVATGATTIKAVSGTISGSTGLTVSPATLVSLAVTPADAGIAKGTKQQFSAAGTYSDGSSQDLTAAVTWSSSNAGVATISNAAGSNGLASSVGTGSTTIKAVSGTLSGSTTLTVNAATLVSIAVTPGNETVAKGANQQFTATGTFSDSSTQNLTAAATWSSTSTAVATISNAAGSNGLATAVTTGSTTVKAVSGSVSGSTALSVVDRSVSLTWDAPTTNTDGTALTDLAGYKLHYGISPGVYTKTVTLGTTTSHVINNLTPGTYYFAVTAVNSAGSESSFSNEAWKTIQ